MELKEALLKRRSVRKFTEEAVSEEMIQELLHAAMSGPSACNKVYKNELKACYYCMRELIQGITNAFC